MEALVQDLKFALRSLRRTPGVTAVAIITLALGIGANTAIFSVVNRLLFHPYPFLDDSRLVAVWSRMPRNDHNEMAAADWLDVRAQVRSLDRVVAHFSFTTNITGEGEPERVQGFRVSLDYFDAMGLKPMLGRDFAPGEDVLGKDKVVLLSWGLWQRRFGGNPAIVGTSVTFNGIPRTVIGVMPQGVRYPVGAEVWVPIALTAEASASRRNHYLYVMGRLAPGATIAEARAELEGIAGRLAAQYPETNTGVGANVQPLLSDALRNLRPMLLVLFAAVGFVLLIACANVANLMLARASGRRRELAIRTALGAARGRISRLVLTESVVLSLAGGAAGVIVGMWGVQLLVQLVPAAQQRFMAGFDQVKVDGPVLAFTAGLALLSSLLFGVAPALRAGSVDGTEPLRGISTGSRERHRLRRGLVATEVALALLLLVGAGLTWRTFRFLASREPGFNGDGVALTNITVPYRVYSGDSVTALFTSNVLARVAAIPGVRVASTANIVPLCGCNSTSSFEIVGEPPFSPSERPEANWRVVSPGYFAALEIPLRAGRLFETTDNLQSGGVVVVNETLSRRWFPGDGAVGRMLYIEGDTTRPVQVIGIVGDIRHAGLAQPVQPEMYVAQAQRPSHDFSIMARTSGDPALLLPLMRRAVQETDRDMPVYDQRTMRDVMNLSVGPYRFSMRLLGGLGVIALLLAGVGIYGVIAHLVAQRTREVGIRMALGGDQRSVQRLIVRQGMMPALLGVGAGGVLALVLTQAMSKLMVGVSPRDPFTFAGVAILLLGVALVACWAPARRAAKVDPMVALRDDT